VTLIYLIRVFNLFNGCFFFGSRGPVIAKSGNRFIFGCSQLPSHHHHHQSPPPPFRPAPAPPRGQHSRRRAPWQLPIHGPSQVEPVEPDYRRHVTARMPANCHVTAPIRPSSRPFAPTPSTPRQSHQPSSINTTTATSPPVPTHSRTFPRIRARSPPFAPDPAHSRQFPPIRVSSRPFLLIRAAPKHGPSPPRHRLFPAPPTSTPRHHR